MIILTMAEGFLALKGDIFRSSKRIARFSFISILSAFLAFHATRIVLLMTIPGPDSLFMDQHLLTSATLLGTMVLMILWAGLVLMLDIERILSRLEHKAMQLERIALNDQLTGIQNRYALETFLDAEIDRQDRYLVPLSLIMLDLDDFKVLNDANGHDSGDKVLIAVANRIRSEIRTTDKAFRWGGEEFLIVLPHTNLDGATSLAEKLRGAVASMDFDTIGRITASFGVTERFPGAARDDFCRRVARAMYRAKTGGRNRVEAIRAERTDGSQPVSVEWRREWESGIEETDREHKAS
jgi:diguanylate cyclase (GGDEF)-like protein